MHKVTTHDPVADPRAERLMLVKNVGQPNCLVCPPWHGENPPKGRRQRPDKYKSRRRGR
jgi:hypothetical protein